MNAPAVATRPQTRRQFAETQAELGSQLSASVRASTIGAKVLIDASGIGIRYDRDNCNGETQPEPTQRRAEHRGAEKCDSETW